MPRRTPGQRFTPASAAAAAAQHRQEQNALAALRAYRAAGGKIRTQEWYRIWRATRDVPPPQPGRPPAGPGVGRPPRTWITNVGVVYYDRRDPTRTETHWVQVYSDKLGARRGQLISDEDAMAYAVDQQEQGPNFQPGKTGANLIPVATFVTSYEAVN